MNDNEVEQLELFEHRWWLKPGPPAKPPALYDEEWVQRDAADALRLKDRLYRAARGSGVVWNGDTVGEARNFAKRQNERIETALACATPIERAIAYWRTSFTKPHDFLWWMWDVEGLKKGDTEAMREVSKDLRRLAPDWFELTALRTQPAKEQEDE